MELLRLEQIEVIDRSVLIVAGTLADTSAAASGFVRSGRGGGWLTMRKDRAVLCWRWGCGYKWGEVLVNVVRVLVLLFAFLIPGEHENGSTEEAAEVLLDRHDTILRHLKRLPYVTKIFIRNVMLSKLWRAA